MHKNYQYNQAFYSGKMQHAKGGVIVHPPTPNPKINEYLSLMHKWFKTFTSLDVRSDNELTPNGKWTREKLSFSLFSQIDTKFCGAEMNSEHLWHSIYIKDDQKYKNCVIYKMANDNKTLHSALTFRIEQMTTKEYYIYVDSFCTNNSAKKDNHLYPNTEKTPAELMREAGSASVLIYRLFDLCVFLGIRKVKLDAIATKESLEIYKRMKFKKLDDSSIDADADARDELDVVEIKHEMSPTEINRIVFLKEKSEMEEESPETEDDEWFAPKTKRGREPELMPMPKHENEGLYVNTGEMDAMLRDFKRVQITNSPSKKIRRVDTPTLLVHINPEEYGEYMSQSSRENSPAAAAESPFRKKSSASTKSTKPKQKGKRQRRTTTKNRHASKSYSSSSAATEFPRFI